MEKILNFDVPIYVMDKYVVKAVNVITQIEGVAAILVRTNGLKRTIRISLNEEDFSIEDVLGIGVLIGQSLFSEI